ncbi:unnamed protein product [Chondrus crispus]|uniref:Uncharacterized protein n=1 Tax=Chondrus crispus TaxID=2769 RepID=R7QIF7_CHOCR|nr:unnamed protein product [Chondrus crispus]CDF37859.1 unnamed protein product [Chondrus crispus]|eukprot:XP_005717730.1 unnamed protein product [Chondrus crispus]
MCISSASVCTEHTRRKHEYKEQQICSANRSNKGYSRAYTLWFQPSHLQVIRSLHFEQEI